VNYLTNWGKAMDEAGVESHAAWVFEAFENGSTIIKEQAESQQATDVQETAKKILSAEKPAEQFATAWANVQDRVNPTTELDSWMVQVMNQIQRANNSDYNKQLKEDDRYFLAKNNKLPRKIDSHLETFDCISCDKCVPVCPNDANFIYFVSPEEIRPVATYVLKAGELQKVNSRDFGVERDHQIGNFADWCNECGNCDTFCPEYDGPYIKKPSFYNTKEAWADDPKHDGFFVSVNGTTELWGRMEGLTHHLVKKGDNSYIWNTSCWHIELDAAGNIGEVAADTGDDEPQSEIDLWEFHVLRKLLEGAQNKQRMNPVNAAFWNELGD
jgi:ferredoxin